MNNDLVMLANFLEKVYENEYVLLETYRDPARMSFKIHVDRIEETEDKFEIMDFANNSFVFSKKEYFAFIKYGDEKEYSTLAYIDKDGTYMTLKVV